MSLSFILLIISTINADESQCDVVPDAPITEIDVLSFVSGSIHDKLAVAKQFDHAFHTLGAVRLINTGISKQATIELLDKTAQFFDEPINIKMQFERTGSGKHGFVPVGGETVGNYKGTDEHKPDPVESLHIASNWANKLETQKGYPFQPNPSALPHYLQDIVPVHWAKTRELAYTLHWIASMALGFDVTENVFETNMTANSLFGIRLSNYPSPQMGQDVSSGFRFNPHQDYTGFTMITNDNVGGLRVSVNDSNDNIIWYKIAPKLGGVIVLGGEFIERWTNSHWISSVHAVKSLPQRRISIIAFVCPDLNGIVDILPCQKCMESERKFEAVRGQDHLENRMDSSFKEYETESE